MHEWKENSQGEILSKTSVNKDGVITWVFEEDSFIPTAKLKGESKHSILTDHLGTPISMFDKEGSETWSRELDSFDRVKSGSHNSCPFMYQGQYYDKEIELAYNRFRYYDPQDGRYISKDPIGLASGEGNLYSYVSDPNVWIDELGLAYKKHKKNGQFAKKPGRKKKPKPSTHGNSHQSKKKNFLYAKLDDLKNFLKWDKSDNPDGRYTDKEMNNGSLEILDDGNIVDIKDIERELAEKVPGIDNKESWAGSKKGQPLSKKAQAIYDKLFGK